MTRPVIQFRVSTEERELIEALAARHDMKLSEWLRMRGTTDGATPIGRNAPPESRPTKHKGPVVIAEEEVFCCPWTGCEFCSPSPQAICPTHGRKVR